MKEATLEDIKTIYEKYSGATKDKKGTIHLIIPPKTGSTQCRTMFKKAAKAAKGGKKFNLYFGGDSPESSVHSGFSGWKKIPSIALKKPALRIGLVRNPWDWLVSFRARFATGHRNFNDFIHWWGLSNVHISSQQHKQSKVVKFTHSPMCQLFYDDGTVGPHLIISTESINEGCQMIFDALEIDFKATGHANQSGYSKKKKKIDFYTSEASEASEEIELVRERLSVLVDFFKYHDGPDTGWNYETPVLINDNSHMDFLPIRGKAPDCWKKD
tara:strand:+ start:872 stop:1684 length:813 start_codon:yes stop_codon:yes gene_type:complete